jgi:hypothetical protein
MQYIFKNTGEEVALERWAWGAIFVDGSELKQFADDGTYHQIGEIDQSKLSLFVMYRTDDPNKRIDMSFKEGMRLVHKYKMVKPYYMQDFVRVYCFGYNKAGQEHRVFILPDDRFIVADHENVDLPDYELDR